MAVSSAIFSSYHLRWMELDTVRRNGYIQKGEVKSLTSFFDVPKDVDDIRLIYNGTSSGLNDSVFAPWFSLPFSLKPLGN